MQFTLIVLALFICLSCSRQEETQLNSKIISGSIINGQDMTASDSLTHEVVGLFNVKTKSICTGTLIDLNIVLTAAHCINDKISNYKIVFSNDIDDIINAREPDVLEEFAFNAVDFRVSPAWNSNRPQPETDTGDIALIKFKGDLPHPYKPSKFLQDSSLLKLNSPITIVGFGVDTVDLEEVDQNSYRDIETEIESGNVHCQHDSKTHKKLCFKVELSGDGKLRKAEAPLSNISKSEFQLNEKLSGTCNGDSGGPAYLRVNNDYFLIGVTSRGSGLCNDIGVYTNTSYYIDWIKKELSTLR